MKVPTLRPLTSPLPLPLLSLGKWEPELFDIKPSLGDYWRAAGLLFANSSKKVDFEILHLPRARLAQLKAATLGEQGHGRRSLHIRARAMPMLACYRASFAAQRGALCKG
jgi:hypothetical protein